MYLITILKQSQDYSEKLEQQHPMEDLFQFLNILIHKVFLEKTKTGLIVGMGENKEEVLDVLLDISKLNPGDYIYVNIFFDSENYPFKMKFLGIENLKTKFGTIECMKLNPYMEAGRVFRSNKGLELWVTNDDNRVPIKVKANLRVGTIVADLTTFRGLTNPFKIVIND